MAGCDFCLPMTFTIPHVLHLRCNLDPHVIPRNGSNTTTTPLPRDPAGAHLQWELSSPLWLTGTSGSVPNLSGSPLPASGAPPLFFLPPSHQKIHAIALSPFVFVAAPSVLYWNRKSTFSSASFLRTDHWRHSSNSDLFTIQLLAARITYLSCKEWLSFYLLFWFCPHFLALTYFVPFSALDSFSRARHEFSVFFTFFGGWRAIGPLSQVPLRRCISTHGHISCCRQRSMSFGKV